MRPPEKIMDRLSAADPTARGRQLSAEQQRDADALLERLLAAPAEPPLTRSRRRWPQLAVATAAVAVAAFAAVSLLGSEDGPAPNVIDNALAALTQDDAIYHAEAIAEFHSSDLPDMKSKPYIETWHTTGGRLRHRTFVEGDGRKRRLVTEFAGRRRPGRRGGPGLAYDARTNRIYEVGFGRNPSVKGAPEADPFDPARSLRQLEAEGKLRVAGRVEVDGRPAYRLVSGNVPGFGHTVQRAMLLVDAETYLPREQRLFVRAPNGETMRVRWRYLTYERLPLNANTESLLDFHPPAGAKCRPGTDKLIRKGSLGFPNPCAR
jgi:hypothetical protein